MSENRGVYDKKTNWYVLLDWSGQSRTFAKFIFHAWQQLGKWVSWSKKNASEIVIKSQEFKYVVDNINEAARGLFENHRVDKIKKFMKIFLLAQKLGYLNDVSNIEIKSSDVDYLIKIKKNFINFNQYIEFCKDCYDDDQIFIDPYPGLKNIYDDYELFCSKFKIKYEDGGSFWDYCTDSDSDSDSD